MIAWKRLTGVLLFAAALPCGAQQGGDLQAQILYAYQTEDFNRLADVMQGLAAQVKAGDASAATRYHLAHAEYRYAALAGARRAQQAEAALSDCTDQLRALLAQDPQSVEALALDAACYSSLAAHRTMQAVILHNKAADRLETAHRLAPRNARVLLLMAEADLARGKPGSPQRARGLAELQEAADIFDRSPATDLDAPGWGHAEAYLVLGRELLQKGDTLGARNWIEKALLAAPDYKAAQRAHAELAHR